MADTASQVDQTRASVERIVADLEWFDEDQRRRILRAAEQLLEGRPQRREAEVSDAL